MVVFLFILTIALFFSTSAEECKSTEKGKDYRGNISVTASGRTCQLWSSKFPHNHQYSAKHFKFEANLTNQCRNPGHARLPWCYTTDKKVRWEYCNIPYCVRECKSTENGKDYRGNISVTASGRTCQLWSSKKPHNHHYSAKRFNYEANLTNQCRNPGYAKLPWCYTTDKKVRWEYCNIPYCVRECKLTKMGKEYRGSKSTTEKGRKCQAWAVQYPQRHKYSSADFKDENIIALGNKCRNPRHARRPWCYTTDPKMRWDYCDISYC